jgi:hypothetical protein
MRTRLPTCLSVELGDFFGMTNHLQRAPAGVHNGMRCWRTNAIHDEHGSDYMKITDGSLQGKISRNLPRKSPPGARAAEAG